MQNQTLAKDSGISWETALLWQRLTTQDSYLSGLLATSAPPCSDEPHQLELNEQQSVLDVQLQLHGKNHPNTAIIYNSIGRQHIKMRQYPLALNSFMQAKEIRESLYGPSHPDTAACYGFIACVHYLMRGYTTAIAWMMKQLTAARANPGQNGMDTSVSRSFISQLYFLAGQADKAREWHPGAS